jgi:hypothetical protein
LDVCPRVYYRFCGVAFTLTDQYEKAKRYLRHKHIGSQLNTPTSAQKVHVS